MLNAGIMTTNALEDQLIELVPADRPSEPPGAVVIGGAIGALGLVRSLGRHGIPTLLIAADYYLAQSSRYMRGRLPPLPLNDHSQAAASLLKIAEGYRLDGWALFPCIDSAVEMIARHHAELSGTFRLTTAPWETLQWVHDKRFVYRRAAEIGLAHPHTYCANGMQQVAALECRYPVILKPASREGRNALTLDKAWMIENRQELLERYAEACAFMNHEKIIIQEFVPGGGEAQYSYAALWNRGCAVASLVAKRRRQYPIDFGHTRTYVETVEEPELEDILVQAEDGIRDSGVVEMEYKRDARDGRYKLLDVNPRLWTWHTISCRAGIDFPYLMWQVISGRDVPRLRGRLGSAWVHLSKDLLAAFQEIRRGRLSIPAYVRSLLRPRLEFAVAAGDDPLPALCDPPLLFCGALKRCISRAHHFHSTR
ncbi:MAG: hypothetical protein JO211_15690 [Acidobacteriaceae bacterium]|nr:hypothetical protein [Acidobacteriaceae bacterium]